MKNLFLVLTLTFSVINLFGQDNLQTPKANQNSFPTNLNNENFSRLKKFDGKIVAFEGVIEQIENSRNNTPFYKIKIGENKYLWTVLMFKNDITKINEKVRVVGYLRPAEPNETEKEYLNGKYMVIAFGLVDFHNSNFLFLGGAEKQKQEWFEGKIPSSK